MDSGLIQILVIAFFIIISMMDGAARKKRKEAQRRGEVGPGEGVGDAGGLHSMKTERASRGRMSEGMVPDELWEEIAALARGGPPPATDRAPYEADRAPSGRERSPSGFEGSLSGFEGSLSGFERPMPARAPEPEETSLRPEHQHVEDHDHVEWASEEEPAYPTVPDAGAEPLIWDDYRLARTEERAVTRSAPPVPERAVSRGMAEPAEAVGESDPDEDPGRASRTPRKGRSVRRTLTHGGRESIRQAVILAEVLGPPVSLRDSDHEPPG